MATAKALKALVLTAAIGLVALAASTASAQSTDSERVGLTRTGSGTFSLDVQGADIQSVVRAIGEFSGRNIVIGKDVKGSVRVSLRNVGWQEALRSVLRSNGLDYVEDNGILRVDDMTKLSQEQVEREAARAKAAELTQLETRIVKLNYANAAELAVSLQASLTKRGVIQVEKRTNSLIVSDLDSNVDRVEKMALELDSTTPQVEITAKLVDVDIEALRNIGVTWNAGGGPPDLSEGDYLPGDLNSPLHPNNDVDQSLSGGVNEPVPNASAVLSYGIVKNWGSIEAQLQALEQDRKANIISNPRITTVDNREAKILVGQKIPLIVQDIAGNPVSQLQTIGIQLKVTPHLTQDRRIIMDLHPEVSDLSTQATVQGGVIINTSEADTRVMVEDGQTAVIGGLIRTNEGVIRRGVPILKDLPLLGFLFRSSNTIRQNRELIIFVTPRLVAPVAAN